MSIDHIISGICNSRIGKVKVILISHNTTLLYLLIAIGVLHGDTIISY